MRTHACPVVRVESKPKLSKVLFTVQPIGCIYQIVILPLLARSQWVGEPFSERKEVIQEGLLELRCQALLQNGR